VFNRLYERLETGADTYAHNRAPENPDWFVFRIVLVDGPRWFECRALVNDHGQPGELVIEDFSAVARPAGG